jgi:hypothetical protein
MKILTRSNIYLSLTAMILIATLSVAGAAQQQPVHFKGNFQGADTDGPGPLPNTITVDTQGTGLGTHLGQFKFSQTLVVDFSGSDSGTATLEAANGDTIYVSITGQGYPTNTPFVFDVWETWTITGGTGRFAGSQGTAFVNRVADGPHLSTSGSFDGTITSPGLGQ